MSFSFRQIHLDFHTSGEIPDVGTAFDKSEFQRTLREAAVDSITCFSLCHHGYSYHPTKVGTMHPALSFNLLRAQIDAAHEVGIRVPVYLSAGGNEFCAQTHPEWREINPPGISPRGAQSLFEPGFHKLCFNSGYLDHLCAMIEEVMVLFPDADGIFLDIVLQRQCCCPNCLHDMFRLGLEPEREEDRQRFSRKVLERYYARTVEAVRKHDPGMPIFHNSGGIDRSHPELLQKYFSHLELESLPTGGWGYDFFPLSAGFARKTGLHFVGMTGKFHGGWGEFGSFKHPNALRYECALALANGAGISIGDQLHPDGRLDESTYRIIGAAYREVREKEPYCRCAKNRAEIALISAASCNLPDGNEFDIGASRFLLESHFLFDLLHPEMDFSSYTLVIFPDAMEWSGELVERINRYLASGGKILLSGRSLLQAPFDLGAEIVGPEEFSVCYLLPPKEFSPDFLTTPFVLYSGAVRMRVRRGISTGSVFDPYFERTLKHFCSHRQTPNRPERSGWDAGVVSESGAALACPVFYEYRQNGPAVLRIHLAKIVEILLGSRRIIRTTLPSIARVFVMDAPEENREIIHLLFAPIVKRGAGVEIIEDLTPLRNVEVVFSPRRPVKRILLVPEGRTLSFESISGGRIRFRVEEFTCHAMISLES